MKNAMHAMMFVALALFAGAPAIAQCELTTSFAGFKDTPDGGCFCAIFDFLAFQNEFTQGCP